MNSTPSMPSTRGTSECRCRLCEPGPLDDPRDKKVLSDVRDHVVHIISVAPGHGPDEPAFAYTVGLWHQARHPELVMTGQRSQLMMHALNAAVAWVRAGQVLTPGTTMEGVVGGFPVAVERLTPEAVQETVTYSRWFHRRPVDAVQLVWTDLHGIFPWQPGVQEPVRTLQPSTWRVPGARAGALAPDPQWVLPIAADRLVFSCSHLEDGEVVAQVVRERDEDRGEDWQVLCASDHADLTPEDVRLVHVAHLVRAAPSLRDLADLGLDEAAERDHPWEPWRRVAIIRDAASPGS